MASEIEYTGDYGPYESRSIVISLWTLCPG